MGALFGSYCPIALSAMMGCSSGAQEPVFTGPSFYWPVDLFHFQEFCELVFKHHDQKLNYIISTIKT